MDPLDGAFGTVARQDLQSEYFDGQEFFGYVDHGVERLDARELVPDHSRVGKAAEYAEFTRPVKRTFQENDPETMAKIKDAMDALGLDIDEAIRRVRGSTGADDESPRLVSPGCARLTMVTWWVDWKKIWDRPSAICPTSCARRWLQCEGAATASRRTGAQACCRRTSSSSTAVAPTCGSA